MSKSPRIAMSTLMVVLSFAQISAKEGSSSAFFSGNFESAKEKARVEDKFFLVDFYASWCLPCKWMEQTTFADPHVKSLMQENFVSVKIDIDEQEGFDLKKKYAIQFLPTILIFNSEGELMGRIEETLPAKKMLDLLTKYEAEPSVVSTHEVNTSPKQSAEDEDGIDFDKDHMTRYRKANENRTYRLQIGVYSDYENAFNRVDKLRETFLEPVIVFNDFRNENVMYKVMMGEFRSQDEAEGFRTILSEKFDIESIVQ